MTPHHWILLASAAVWLAAAPAAAGLLDFWEDTHGAQGVTATYSTGVAQIARIYYDADSAEGGGLWDGPSEITIEPRDSLVFVDFDCAFHPCVQNDDYVFTPGAVGAGRLKVTDWDASGETHGIREVGTILFDGPQEPGSMPLVSCHYTGLDNYTEHTCSPFVLVQLPEPGGLAALLSGAALAFGLRRRRTH